MPKSRYFFTRTTSNIFCTTLIYPYSYIAFIGYFIKTQFNLLSIVFLKTINIRASNKGEIFLKETCVQRLLSKSYNRKVFDVSNREPYLWNERAPTHVTRKYYL